MYKYAQIDSSGNLEGLSSLSGEVISENLVPVSDEEYRNLSDRSKRSVYKNGEWVEVD